MEKVVNVLNYSNFSMILNTRYWRIKNAKIYLKERLRKKIHSELRPTNNNYDNIKIDPRLLRILEEL